MAKSSLLLKISKKVKISGISSDSRLVKKDDVFFAVTGYLIDGLILCIGFGIVKSLLRMTRNLRTI